MTAKETVLLAVLIDTSRLGWRVAGIDMTGGVTPLLCSAAGNLKPYVGVSLDEQVTFLRHRLSGVLQRGCDRLWGRQQKPCQIVFLADGLFTQADPGLTLRVAEHFVEWMTKPAVVFFTIEVDGRSMESVRLKRIAGQIAVDHLQALRQGLPALLAAARQAEGWELEAPRKPPGE
jgi:hypothetical protein